MSKILDRAGVGAALNQAQHDSNLSSLAGINEAVAGATYTVAIDDQNRTLEFTGTGCAVTLPAISTIVAALHTDDFKVTFKSVGTGNVVITRGGTDTFEGGSTSITLTQYEYLTIQTDSTGGKWNILSTNVNSVTNISSTDFNITFDTSASDRQLRFNTGTKLSYITGTTAGDISLYDSTNARGVWAYDESANTFSITPPLSNTSPTFTTPTLNGALAGSSIQVGTVDSTGTMIKQSGTVASSRTAAGLYRLTHNLGTTDYSLFILPVDATVSPGWASNTSTTIDVSIRNNSGTLTDSVFFFQLIQF